MSEPQPQPQPPSPPQPPPQPDASPQPPSTDPQSQDPPPPASPPLPLPHTATTPGPRATRLQELYAQRLRHTLGRLAWDKVAGCYPTVASRAEGVLRQVQAQMVEKLGAKCEKEFEAILVARQVVPKLNHLESLVSEAARRRADADDAAALPTPPHLLPPTAILSAHLTPALAAHQSQLNARLQTTQSQNALLFEEVQRQRQEIDALLAQLEGVVADVKGANEALGDVVADIAAEAREAGPGAR